MRSGYPDLIFVYRYMIIIVQLYKVISSFNDFQKNIY